MKNVTINLHIYDYFPFLTFQTRVVLELWKMVLLDLMADDPALRQLMQYAGHGIKGKGIRLAAPAPRMNPPSLALRIILSRACLSRLSIAYVQGVQHKYLVKSAIIACLTK